MKKLEKEQLPTVIALGAMAAVLLGYAGYTWLGHGGGEATPAAAAAPHPVDPGQKAASTPSAADKVLALAPINHENPFIPAFTAESAQTPPAPAKPAAPKSKDLKPFVAALPDMLKGPAMDGLPGLPPVAPRPSAAAAIKPPAAASRPHLAAKPAPEPPKPPAVLVTGILEGQENVAILKWSDTQRQVVRSGDHLDGGYVVKAIRSDAVVVARGNSEWVIRLGAATKA